MFGSTFGSPLGVHLVLPVVAVCLVVLVAFEPARRTSRPLRLMWPVPALLVGALVIVWTVAPATTSGGLPGERSAVFLWDGVLRSWLLTLQSTLPARTTPATVAFVPELVLLGAVAAVLVLAVTERRLAALVPSLVIAVLAELFHPLAAGDAAFAVLGYAVPVAMLLGSLPTRPRLRAFGLAAVGVLLGALLGSVVDPVPTDAVSLRDHVPSVPPPPADGASVLNDIPTLLRNGHVPAFSVRGDSAYRWPCAVYDHYENSEWTERGHLRYLGDGVHSPAATAVPTRPSTAEVLIDPSLPGPCVPSQHGLDGVSGLDDTVVNEQSGSLYTQRSAANHTYRLEWAAPQVTSAGLASEPLDSHAAGVASVGRIPRAIRAVAHAILHHPGRTVADALVVERWMRTHLHLAVGDDLPQGHSWDQVIQFLAPGSSDDLGLTSTNSGRRGTSEQFATGYVVIARALGMPARLVVGFQQPSDAAGDGAHIVYDDDVLAWPEVAVRGVGWVPLNPDGAPGPGSDHPRSPLVRAIADLRAQLPPNGRLPRSLTSAPRPTTIGASDSSTGVWLHRSAVVLLSCLLALLLLVPASKSVRHAVRRRLGGRAAIVAAWREACDRLVDHGVEVRRSMTVREVAGSAATTVDAHVVRAVGQLGMLVDDALWSGEAARPVAVRAAWHAVDAVRSGLAMRPMPDRLAAGLTIRSLRPR